MSTKSLGSGFRHVTDKAGKVKVVKRPPRMAAGQRKNLEGKAASLAKRWQKRSKSP